MIQCEVCEREFPEDYFYNWHVPCIDQPRRELAMTTYDSQYVFDNAKPRGAGWSQTHLVLNKGETAWNPASTKTPIHGPATVEYDIAPDGGVTAYVGAKS